MDEVKVIPTERDHLAFITATEKLCFSNPWSENSFAYALDNPNVQSCFTALYKGEPAGYMCLFHLFEEGELLNVAVSPDLRNKGIAQKMMDKMVEHLKEKGVERITLEVRESNAAARHLYERNGFTRFAIRKNYYSSPVENGIIMEKHI